MSLHKVINKQSLIDIAIMRFGNIDAVFDLIAENNLGLDKPVGIGTEILYTESDNENEDVLQYYIKKKTEPVTDVKKFEPESNWILLTGFWRDVGVWEDDAFWIDSL